MRLDLQPEQRLRGRLVGGLPLEVLASRGEGAALREDAAGPSFSSIGVPVAATNAVREVAGEHASAALAASAVAQGPILADPRAPGWRITNLGFAADSVHHRIEQP